MHEKEVGGTIAKGGYPDTGFGKYTFEAGYKVWYELAKGQRVHLNYLEGHCQLFACELVAGLYLPIVTAVLGLVYILGRLAFHIGYMMAPGLRIYGVYVVLII